MDVMIGCIWFDAHSVAGAMDVVLGRMAKNQEFCEKYLEDEEFRREVDKILLPLVPKRLSKM